MVNGTVTNKTCDEACGNDCCTGDFSYDWFTGKVCRDETSCMGVDACLSATISHVINSCNGPSACDYAGLHYPIGGDITNSCNGNEACYQLSYYGTAGNIDSSCNGYSACIYLAYGGTVGNIARSCNVYKSYGDASNNTGDEGGGVCFPIKLGQTCLGLGLGSYGSVGDIEESCHGDGACYADFWGYSSVGNIKSSCKGKNACANAFYDGLLPEGALNECCNKNCGCLELQTVTPTDCKNPSNQPSTSPSTSPSEELSNSPSISPSVQPSSSPSKNPSN